ncbi:M56 family metallopeptidase [Chryseobacterium lathyri]|uniref:M56 family metallopeptidase n=1 Tax=Chryseobacterium lathyri TaxID=395933 RepID=UPI001CBF92E4|nr:M56 family metallopeptidase [Chryseobacterium lathyri]
MFIIVLKMLLCSSVCIAVYYLFLEKEKMYRFNRFYLLVSLIFSLVIPFISITVQPPKTVNKSEIIFEDAAQQIIQTQPAQEIFDWINLVWFIYGAVALFLLIKSILSIIAIRNVQGEKMIYQNYTVKVAHENLPPFSFWNTIYLGRSYIKNNIIDPRIFLHEKNHIDQKHSIDLIFIDILKIFTWFNPILHIYKKAIITNHEFLADKAVLNSRYDIKEYQNLILDEIINIQNPPLTHSFNFNNTKKRFIMMTKKKSRFTVLKKMAGITTLIAATALFAERTYAVNPIAPYNPQKVGAGTVENVESPQVTSTNSGYFEKIKEKPSKAVEFKKESTKAAADTISPKKTAQANSNEGNNTNVNQQEDRDFVQAEFPEGAKLLRSKIGSMLDTSIFDGKEKLVKSTAHIHVDETGKISQITASGDNETFNKEIVKTVTAVNNGMVWKPATRNGKATASIFTLPMSMSFQ